MQPLKHFRQIHKMAEINLDQRNALVGQRNHPSAVQVPVVFIVDKNGGRVKAENLYAFERITEMAAPSSRIQRTDAKPGKRVMKLDKAGLSGCSQFSIRGIYRLTNNRFQGGQNTPKSICSA